MPLLVALITVNIVLGALIWSDATAQRRTSERLSAKDRLWTSRSVRIWGRLRLSLQFRSACHAEMRIACPRRG
jgi:hypothetical protein